MFTKLKNKMKNQKGFTLVEILVVIVIIGILFTVVLPRINFAPDKARTVGVKKDFQQYNTSFSQVLRTVAGKGVTVGQINKELDSVMRFSDASATTAAGVSTTTSDSGDFTDPWKKAYSLRIVENSNDNFTKVVVTSTGKSTNTEDQFVMAAYYYNGVIDSCTSGFGEQDVVLGGDITLVDGKCGNDVVVPTP